VSDAVKPHYTRNRSVHPPHHTDQNRTAHRVMIMTKDPEANLTGDEREKVAAMVLRARQILPRIVTALADAALGNASPQFKFVLNLIFLKPDANQILAVIAKLELVQNGITLKHRLKIHDIPTSPDDDPNRAVNAWGYVRWKSDGTRGSINMHRELFAPGGRDQSQQRLVTFIHEASHKYADTKDHPGGNFEGDSDAAGYKNPGLLTTQQAIDNADSYGWFCVYAADVLRL
jgi:hypothetical protein